MSQSRESSNPLRPYYIPPSIGIPQNTTAPGTTSSGTHGLGPRNGSAASYASSARDIFSDIDYSDYLEASPSSYESMQEAINSALYKYTSVLFCQPFVVAKTILQVRSQDAAKALVVDEIRSRNSSYRNGMYEDNGSDDSDQDEMTYFTSAAPSSSSYSPSRSRRRRSDRSPSPEPIAISTPSHQLTLKQRDSLMEVISQEWTKEGLSGVWKGSNATFIYMMSSKLLEAWSRGFLSAVLSIPDPGVTKALGPSADLLDTNYPWASLGLAVAAAVITGLALAPLDLVRTKVMLTPTSNPKRSASHYLRTLPSYVCPTAILLPTVLHSLIAPTFAHSTPLLLRSRLGIEPALNPSTYSFFKLGSRILELFVSLPLETVLRRGQMAVLASPEYRPDGLKATETTVNIGPYNGIFGTMWSVAREEGVSEEPVIKGGKITKKVRGQRPERKGQGLGGLWRGWKIGIYGLAGTWVMNAVGTNGTNAGEF